MTFTGRNRSWRQLGGQPETKANKLVLPWYYDTMDTVPAKLTRRLVEEIDEMVREGWYANRSELIRDAVRQAIKRARTGRLEAAIKEDVEWGLRGKDKGRGS